MRRPTLARTTRGFTLIELLVAIAVLALLAVISWRGIDGMARAQAQLRERADAVLTLQSTLGQWRSDLDATVTLAPSLPIDWNGSTLRLTRRSSDGSIPSLLVVAWTLRADDAGVRWHRWQSPPLVTRSDWQRAWEQAASWAQGSDGPTRAGSEIALLPVAAWQVLYLRNELWSPAVGTDALPAGQKLPDGVRLVLSLPPGPALAGTLTLDWVRPNATIAKTS